MKRLIVISFLFMGFAFYELSGGADFEPRGLRPVKPERVAAAVSPPAKPTGQGRVEAVALVSSSPVLAPRDTDRPTSGTENERREDAATEQAAQDENPLERVRITLGQNLSLLTQTATGTAPLTTGQLTLVSLDQGAEGLRETAIDQQSEPPVIAEPDTPPAPDIREISGTRVNMRDGPGTIYPVIARMVIGHKVEVLSESGTGWLRLRSLQGHQVGWVAASLVSKPAR